MGKGLGLLIQSKNDSEKAETGETIRNRTDGFNALLLRQHHGDMDLVETVMYGHQLPIKSVTQMSFASRRLFAVQSVRTTSRKRFLTTPRP